ncbi:MAG: histidinol dehydrogenase, partial [Lachnospiraceae bacterium]|nr:histidinol dehydrogenase [Lachnospiraceae bacterium]
VGVYVPGGRASYPSSVLMNVIPAKVAGVKEIVMTTPCGKDGRVSPVTLVAADIAGVTEAYRVGGAQAIGALAYGTETIRKTDKITGPGNIYVALAKRQVYGAVSIDSVAGPSEILVLCDETAKPECVAADLLSQAEHDPLAAAICVTTDEYLAQRIAEEKKAQTARRLRREIIERSLTDYGHIFVAETIEDAVEAVNEIASEHLEVVTKEPFALLPKIRHAGAVFLGPHSSEPLGDYMAGPNHILPTCGTARFFSPLSVHDFVKRSSVIYFTEDALSALEKDIRTFAKSEGLTAHAAAIAVRFGEEESDI